LRIQSVALVPIIRRDNLWGFIAFATETTRLRPPEEIERLRIVANIVAMVIGYHEQMQDEDSKKTCS
jgi:GAF domain-containing protein